MSDESIKRLSSRKFLFAILLLVALCAARAFDWIDGAQFMTGYLALGAGYFTVNYAAKAKDAT